ncbi:MAG: hypothetical protein ABII74_07180 [Elusimicrobiota bacterium]
MQGPDLLYIAFGGLLIFCIIIGIIVIHQDWKEKHSHKPTQTPPK